MKQRALALIIAAFGLATSDHNVTSVSNNTNVENSYDLNYSDTNTTDAGLVTNHSLPDHDDPETQSVGPITASASSIFSKPVGSYATTVVTSNEIKSSMASLTTENSNDLLDNQNDNYTNSTQDETLSRAPNLEDTTNAATDSTRWSSDLTQNTTNVFVSNSPPNNSWVMTDEATPAVTLTSCEMTTERRLSVIQSPGFPSPYAANIECRYSVKRYSLDVCSVTFLFNVFDLESSKSCSKDYVDLHGEKLCGAKTTGLTRSVPFRTIDDQVVLHFRSDYSTSGLGFMATVVQQECPPPDCDHQFSGIKFELRSPGFPGPYENRQLCDYTVVRASPAICRIRLQVQLFDVEAADHCDADSLEIRGDKLCGNIPVGEIVTLDFREPLLMLRFRTDRTTTRDGFHLLGTQEECPDDVESANTTTTDSRER